MEAKSTASPELAVAAIVNGEAPKLYAAQRSECDGLGRRVDVYGGGGGDRSVVDAVGWSEGDRKRRRFPAPSTAPAAGV